jgi:predicted DNA-binding transcriptional regulator AlpA
MAAPDIKSRLNAFDQSGKSPYLDQDQAAAFLGLSPSTLQKLRVVGGGPRYLKWGYRSVRYLAEDLVEWAESSSRISTSQSN